MKWLDQFAKVANDALMVLIALVAGVMLMSGLYVLNDIFYANRTAFISYDLLQYRPKAQEKDDTGDNGFEDLQKINPDTVGWIEMIGTNINYPIVQGNDNLEHDISFSARHFLLCGFPQHYGKEREDGSR